MDPTLKAEIDKIDKQIEECRSNLDTLEDRRKDLIKGIKFIDYEKEQTLKKLETEFIGKILKRKYCYEHTRLADKKKKMKGEEVKFIEKTIVLTFMKVTGVYFGQTFVGLIGDEIRFTIPGEENTEYTDVELGIKTREKCLTSLRCIYGDPGERDLRREYSAEDFTKDFYSDNEISSLEEIIATRDKVLAMQKDYFASHFGIKSQASDKESIEQPKGKVRFIDSFDEL